MKTKLRTRINILIESLLLIYFGWRILSVLHILPENQLINKSFWLVFVFTVLFLVQDKIPRKKRRD